MSLPLVLHPQAREKIRERIADTAREKGEPLDYDRPDNLHRLKMGEFPAGADIIPNSFNKIPGFSVANSGGIGAHHFVPGFPVMAGPMVEWVLDSLYPHLFHQRPMAERAVLVFRGIESLLTPLMEAIEAEFGAVKVFSLPHVGDANTRAHIELGVKGDPEQVSAAYLRLKQGLDALAQDYQEIT